MRKILAAAGATLAAAVLTLTGGTSALAAGTKVIHVPDDFNPKLSDTRTTGRYEVQGTGLHIWTTGSTKTDKVAEYVDTSRPLAKVGEPSLDYTNTSGGVPGFQLVVDFDDNGTDDGILVGEPVYKGNWWLADGAQFVKDDAPHTGGGNGSNWFGTLDEWRKAFPKAKVLAFGFSLGSGVKGDGILNAINFAGRTYTFAKPVTPTGEDQCKNGGWETSPTGPVYKNQGDCVSSFASKK